MTMQPPKDPFMLVSMLNMKLRDEDYNSLTELFDNLGLNKDEIIKQLKEAGFEFLPEQKQFR